MELTKERLVELKQISTNLRHTILEMIHTAGSGHIGGSLSCVEIITTLYLEKMNFDPRNPLDPGRDRFILSKGHAVPTLYAMLSYLGLIPRSELLKLRKIGSILQGHPDMRSVPGIEMSAGPLGLGLSAGIGMALAAQLNKESYHTYVLLGDGELQEGIIWEAAMTANKYKLNNLTAILDNNGVQLDGCCEEIMPLGQVAAKFASFGWQTLTCDGHNIAELMTAFEKAESYHTGPSIIIAKTVKGKGVSFMEGKNTWHGRKIEVGDYRQAIAEVGGISYAE
ncbi:MAG TPA: transketolase [Firmicutes bacterium]|jgi:transketolase|nr:transketolase [Bacillota bacterium]HBT16284.1 transketolase [Bacillota bacterium]